MGDRGQIKIVIDDTKKGVYLYTHHGATDLIDVLRSALKRGEDRFTDSEYISRIIFNEMTMGEETGLTGYGIGLAKHGDVWRLITVDPDDDIIMIEDHDKLIWKGNHNDFIANELEITLAIAAEDRGN